MQLHENEIRKTGLIQKFPRYSEGDIIGALEVDTGAERLAVVRTEGQVWVFAREQLEKTMVGNAESTLIPIRNPSIQRQS